MMLSEATVKLDIVRTYRELKLFLIKNNCKIVAEEPPNHIVIKQGSLSGILPRSAKKIVDYSLSLSKAGTRISAKSIISSDWANLTLYGNIVAAIMAGAFLWVATDMESYVATMKRGVWGWLAEAYGYPDLQKVTFMVDSIRVLAIFLVIAIVAELLIVVYIYPRKNKFAEESLHVLQSIPF